MSVIAKTPRPPYYAVIFTSHRTEGDNGYEKMANCMIALTSKQPGFLGLESARKHVGVTVSYWSDLDSIQQWKKNIHHCEAKKLGCRMWYSSFKTRICKVEQDYGM